MSSASLKYYYDHKKEINERIRLQNLEKKRIVVEHYSNGTFKCNCCSEDDFSKLTIDHIYGGGMYHRHALKTGDGAGFYRWLIKKNFPSGYQILCKKCNFKKGKKDRCPCQDGKIKLQPKEIVVTIPN